MYIVIIFNFKVTALFVYLFKYNYDIYIFTLNQKLHLSTSLIKGSIVVYIFFYFFRKEVKNYIYFYIIIFFFFLSTLIFGIIWAMNDNSWINWWFGEDIEELSILFFFSIIVFLFHIFTNKKLKLKNLWFISLVFLLNIFVNYFYYSRHNPILAFYKYKFVLVFLLIFFFALTYIYYLNYTFAVSSILNKVKYLRKKCKLFLNLLLFNYFFLLIAVIFLKKKIKIYNSYNIFFFILLFTYIIFFFFYKVFKVNFYLVLCNFILILNFHSVFFISTLKKNKIHNLIFLFFLLYNYLMVNCWLDNDNILLINVRKKIINSIFLDNFFFINFVVFLFIYNLFF